VSRPIPGPLHHWAPPRVTTNGDLAIGLGADLGWDLDEYQRWFLNAVYAEDDEGLPASSDVAIIGPRQTVGKTASLECAAIADVAIFGVPLHIWTAHEFKTARKAFEDMRSRLLAHPDYAARVRFRDSHGEEAIFLDTGERIEFHARSGGSGRGFTTSRITLDEALYLQPGDLGALVPTMVTMEDAQIRYGSSAGKMKSEALRAVRKRGRNPQPGETMAYIEFGAPRRACEEPQCAHEIGTPGCALDDHDLWWQANSGLWYGRVTFESMERQRRALPSEEFSREFLSWWDEPGAADAFGPGRWEACAGDPPSADLPVTGMAVAVSYDLRFAAIVAAGKTDELVHVAPLRHGPGTGWVAKATAELQKQYGVGEVAIDAGGPAADLIPALEAENVTLRKFGTSDVLDACAGIYKRVQERMLRHATYPELEGAARAAVKRTVGDRWAWGRKQSDADISTLEAATFAVRVADTAKPKRRSIYEDRGLETIG
jgi:hypothetical protein